MARHSIVAGARGGAVKSARAITTVLVLVVVGIAVLGLLYGLPTGRQARRESLRVLRLARNATGIYALPVLTVRMWSASRGALLVEMYQSGRVVVSGRGNAFERQLTPAIAGEIFGIGTAALADFSSDGCGTEPRGVSADLYLLLDGRWVGSLCRDASDWPRGFETKRLLEQLAREVPELSGRL